MLAISIDKPRPVFKVSYSHVIMIISICTSASLAVSTVPSLRSWSELVIPWPSACSLCFLIAVLLQQLLDCDSSHFSAQVRVCVACTKEQYYFITIEVAGIQSRFQPSLSCLFSVCTKGSRLHVFLVPHAYTGSVVVYGSSAVKQNLETILF